MRLANINDVDELVQLRMEFLETDDKVVREQNKIYFTEHLNKDLYAGIVAGESCVVMQIMQAPPNTWAKYARYGLMEIILDKAREEKLEYVELQASVDGKNTYTSFGFEPGGYSKYTYMKKTL